MNPTNEKLKLSSNYGIYIAMVYPQFIYDFQRITFSSWIIALCINLFTQLRSPYSSPQHTIKSPEWYFFSLLFNLIMWRTIINKYLLEECAQINITWPTFNIQHSTFYICYTVRCLQLIAKNAFPPIYTTKDTYRQCVYYIFIDQRVIQPNPLIDCIETRILMRSFYSNLDAAYVIWAGWWCAMQWW